MADNTIDTLSLEIVSSSSQANKALDSLAKKLLNVSKSLQSVNTGGLRNYARDMGRVSASIKALNGTKVNIPNLGGLTKQLSELAKVDFSKLSSGTQPIKDLAAGLQSLSGLQNVSIPKLETKNINSVISAIGKLQGIDTTKIPQISDGMNRIAHSMSVLNTVNFSDTKITTVIGALKRLLSVDMSGFDVTVFSSISTAVRAIAGLPDVSSSLNRFIASLAKLASTGASINIVSAQLPILGKALQETVNKMSRAGNISESVNMFTQSIGRLASAGTKTGQTAAGLQDLAQETLKFFETMTKAPKISKNTIAMTQALAQLAAAGGKVGTATGTITSAFGKLSGLGNKAASAVRKAANIMVSSFKRIGSGSKHLNMASFSLGNLARSLLPILGIGQLFNWGKEAMEISSDLTEVQNVVDVTFGDMKQKVEDLASVSIKDFGMSELTAKEIASRYQAMGNAMGIPVSKFSKVSDILKKNNAVYGESVDSMADMSVELTKLAADMASFYNMKQSDVAKNLQSVFTGEAEPLRKYGLDLTNATVQEWALKQGLDANMQSMTQAEKTLLRYQYVMSNSTAAMHDFRRTQDSWANQTRILSQRFQELGSVVGGTLINALKPLVKALNSVMGKVIEFARTVSEALGAIFGWKIEVDTGGITNDLDSAGTSAGDLADSADDAAGGLGDASGAAQKLKKALSVLPFDELNQLVSNMENAGKGGSDGSGSGNAGGSGAGSGANAAIVPTDSIFKKYESEIKNLEQLGEYISNALTKAMQNIDWNSIYSNARGFGKGLADFLNGLITPELFWQTGRTIAGALNTALHALDSFGKTFNWVNFGKSLADGINGFFNNFDFGLLSSTLVTWANGLLDAMVAFTGRVQWGRIGEKVATCIKDTLGGIRWDKAYVAASNFGRGLATFLNKLITPSVFAKIGHTIAGALNTVISGAYSFLSEVDWTQWGQALGTGLNTFFSDFDWEKAGLTLNELISGFVEFLKASAETGRWNEFGYKIGTLITQIPWGSYLKYAAMSIIKILADFLKGLWDSGNVGKIAAGITAAFLAVKVNDITGISTLAGKVIAHFAKAFMKDENTTTLMAALKTVLSSAANKASGALSGLGEAASTTASGGLKTLITSILGQAGLYVGIVLVIDGIAHLVEKLQGGNGKLSEMGGAINDLAGKLQVTGQLLPQQADEISKIVDQCEDAKMASEEMANVIMAKFQEWGLSTEQVTAVLQSNEYQSTKTAGSIDILAQSAQMLGEGFSKTAETIDLSSVTVEDAWKAIDSAIRELALSGGEFAGTYQGVLNALDETKNYSTTAQQSFDAVVTAIENTGVPTKEFIDLMKKKFPDAVKKAETTTTTAVSNIQSSVQTSMTTASGTVSRETDNITKDVNDMASEVEKKVDASYGNVESTSESAWNNSYGFVATSLGSIESDVKRIMRNVMTTIQSYWSSVLINTNQIWEKVSGKISTELGNASSTAESAASDIMNAFSGLGNRIVNNMGNLYGAGASAAQSFANGFRSVHIPVPYLYISSWDTHRLYNGGWFQTPKFSVNWYRKGGLFDGASVIGVGEAGKEAVLPLENRKTMSMIADSITANANGMGVDQKMLTNAVAQGVAMAMMNNQPNQPAQYIQNSIYLDGDVMARAVTKAQQKIDYRTNPTPMFG